jgi:hypothetical protein
MPVMLVVQPGGNSSRTSCGRLWAGSLDAGVDASVMNVGAPLIIAKSASTQLLRTVSSWL